MTHIHILPDSVTAAIAAGEVIERPLYAVKELIENALDAKATSIQIALSDGGRAEITVSDNGIGMDKEDLALSIVPHATSKLELLEDLTTLTSLGFRGEALASLAAVSDLTIQSRQKQAATGYRIDVKHGVAQKPRPTGMPVGTIVTVKRLFQSVPARQKFLKSAAVELRHISQLVLQYAVAHPLIEFRLMHNNKTLIHLPVDTSVATRIPQLFGSLSASLFSFAHEQHPFHISGQIGSPHIVSPSTRKQYIFLNNRPISDRKIAQAVKLGYGTSIDPDDQPVFALFLTIPPHFIDVNVHPRKEEVAFLSLPQLTEAVSQAVTHTLKQNDLIYQPKKTPDRLTTSLAGEFLKQKILPTDRQQRSQLLENAPLTQLENLYLVATTSEGLIIIDQHAAHERILYEKFHALFKKQTQKNQTHHLAKPVLIELTPPEALAISEFGPELAACGITIDHFQKNTFRITTLPALLQDRHVEQLFRELLDDLMEDAMRSRIDTRSHRMICYLSCRAAIKAGDPLTKEQMKTLITQLNKTPHNTTCPHGRPVSIRLALDDLHHLFKRM